MSAFIRVEVVYALPLAQDCSLVEVEAGATVAQAIERSGVLNRHPELQASTLRAGIWGRRAGLGAALSDRDRVEIYRPLRADPMEVRRRRAARKRASNRAS
jgi:putative ubiquitin-RnfH superfamily antitoxin RatB of RatAB toxin-antitoxin module